MQLSFFDVKNPVDEIRIPHDGSGPGVSWVKQAELGEGNAELLRRFVDNSSAFPYKGKTVVLTGPQELSYGQVVDILSKITGKQIRLKAIADEEWAAIQQVKDNLTYGNVEYGLVMASVYEAARQGEAASISPLLRDLLGREPETFETTVSEMRKATSEGHTFWGK